MFEFLESINNIQQLPRLISKCVVSQQLRTAQPSFDYFQFRHPPSAIELSTCGYEPVIWHSILLPVVPPTLCLLNKKTEINVLYAQIIKNNIVRSQPIFKYFFEILTLTGCVFTMRRISVSANNALCCTTCIHAVYMPYSK